MATATMTYTGAADGNPTNTLTHIGTVDDAIVAHFFDAYRAQFGQVQQTDANGNLLYTDNAQNPPVQTTTASRTTTPLMRNMTDAETWQKYTQGVAAGTAAFVQGYLRNQAMAQAVTALPNVAVTQQS